MFVAVGGGHGPLVARLLQQGLDVRLTVHSHHLEVSDVHLLALVGGRLALHHADLVGRFLLGRVEQVADGLVVNLQEAGLQRVRPSLLCERLPGLEDLSDSARMFLTCCRTSHR